MSYKPLLNRLTARSRLLLFLLLPMATSCFWGSEFETRHLIGHYYLDGFEARGEWYLHLEDEKEELGGALINEYVAGAGFNKNCIVLRVASTGPQFYIIPLGSTSDVESREFVQSKIIGPLTKAEFQATVRRLNKGELVPFDPELTSY